MGGARAGTRSYFDELQRRIGLTPLEPKIDTTVFNKVGGVIGWLSPWSHAVLEMVYLTRGAMHERLTYRGYKLMEDRLTELGEKALANTIVIPILSQEAGHLGYYRLAANQIKQYLSPRQLAVARWISLKTYAPVGAGGKSDRPHFGHVAYRLAGDKLPAFAKPIQDLGAELLGDEEHKITLPFVLSALMSCVDRRGEYEAIVV